MVADGCHDHYGFLNSISDERSHSPPCLPWSDVLLLKPFHQGTTAGREQEGVFFTQPCCWLGWLLPGQDPQQEGIFVCSGQLVSPLQSLGTAQEPPGSSPLAWGFARCDGPLPPPTCPQGSSWWGWGDTALSSSTDVFKLAPLLTSVRTQWYPVNNTWLVHAGVWFGNYATAFN